MEKVVEDSPHIWVPATYVGDLDETPASCFWHGTAMTVGSIWKVTTRWECSVDVCLPIAFLLCKSHIEATKSLKMFKFLIIV